MDNINSYQLYQPIVGNRIYKSTSLKNAADKCYNDFKDLHCSGLYLDQNKFSVRNINTDELYVFETKIDHSKNSSLKIQHGGEIIEEDKNKLITEITQIIDSKIEPLVKRLDALESKNTNLVNNTGDATNEIKPDEIKEETKPDEIKEETKPDEIKEETKPDEIKEETKRAETNNETNQKETNNETNQKETNNETKEETNPDETKDETNNTELQGGKKLPVRNENILKIKKREFEAFNTLNKQTNKQTKKTECNIM